MSIGGYKIRDQSAIHFLSFATVEWIDVFTRKEYRDIVVESLRYCQEHKHMELYAWCIMSNHLHMIAAVKCKNLSNLLRDLKRYTASRIISAICDSTTESRREWMLKIFREQGAKNSRNATHQFWRQDNCPMECYSPRFTVQKLMYIHNNPVVAGVVEKPEDYIYSSARAYKGHLNEGLLQVTFL